MARQNLDRLKSKALFLAVCALVALSYSLPGYCLTATTLSAEYSDPKDMPAVLQRVLKPKPADDPAQPKKKPTKIKMFIALANTIE